VVVVAGEIIGQALQDHPAARILPLDSEHCGVFQCLGAPQNGVFGKNSAVKKIWLTASGGPFLRLPREEFSHITVAQALRHPTWSMGAKVSVDAATLANKGLEEIEAAHLFQLTPEQIGVVVQPSSQAHALVELRGGTTLAALYPPSMEFPLALCLNHPHPPPVERDGIDFSTPIRWEFFPPDRDRFPCLALAEEALRTGKSAPCDFDAANAEAVQAFLGGKISFDRIPILIGRALEAVEPAELPTVEAVEERHGMVRRLVRGWGAEGPP
jgi:1-deoxy-D-xylulose-5-phosphate reductoisomerase